MKEPKKAFSKEKKIAIGFTVGVHVIAITGLLFLGLTKPPETPKPIKTVLVKPEDLKPPTPLVESDHAETAHENVQPDIQQTNEPVKDAPIIPVAPPVTTPPKKVEEPKSNLQAQQQAAKAKQEAERKAAEEAQRKAKSEADARAKAAAESKAKAAEEQKARQEQQQKAKTDAALKAKQEADRKAKAEADKKAKAEADRKAKADADKKAKADADRKAKADADAKAKADADRKAKADADAKAKADADRKAKADAEAKERAEAEARQSAAQKAKEEAANKKAESKRIASSAKRDFEKKIENAWRAPMGASGQKATARITLSDSGAVNSVIVNASDPDVKASVEQAVRAAAPYPMPSDPDARREARILNSTFTVK